MAGLNAVFLLATLKRRATAAGVATIYINDNFGQWRSDFRRTVAWRLICVSWTGDV